MKTQIDNILDDIVRDLIKKRGSNEFTDQFGDLDVDETTEWVLEDRDVTHIVWNYAKEVVQELLADRDYRDWLEEHYETN